MTDRTSTRPHGRTLILGTDTRVVLAIARSLGRQGIEVHLGWTPKQSVARHSRYVRRIHDLPSHNTYGTAWSRPLLDLIGGGYFDLVIPCNDSTLVPLQNQKELFSNIDALHLLPPQVFAVAFDKLRSWQLARQLGVPVPEGVAYSTRVEAGEVLRQHRLPLILKPRTTYSLARAGSDVVRAAHTPEDLQRLLDSPALHDGVLIQEVVPGTGVGVELLAHEGNILTAFQHRRLHESMEYGSSYRISVALDPDLLDAAQRLMRALRYSGLAMVEFRKDFATGRWVFLEINARFWGSLPLAVAAGADFPFYLYQYHVLGERAFPSDYQVGVRCRNLELDLAGLPGRIRLNGRVRMSRVLREAGELLWMTIGGDHFDNCSLDDPWPGTIEFGRLVRSGLSKPWRQRATPPSTNAFHGAIQPSPIQQPLSDGIVPDESASESLVQHE